MGYLTYANSNEGVASGSGVSLFFGYTGGVTSLKLVICLTVCGLNVIKHVELSSSGCKGYPELEGYCQQTANSQHQRDEREQFWVSM